MTGPGEIPQRETAAPQKAGPQTAAPHTAGPQMGGPKMAGPQIEILPDERSLAETAARLIASEARRAVERSERFTVALAGGSSPRATYELLARPPLSGKVPWESTHVFWGDERCVGPGDQRSNERMAREALLDHVPIPARQVHPMRCSEADGEEPEVSGERQAQAAADRYEQLLRAEFPKAGGRSAGEGNAGLAAGLGLVLLGLGEDGHTASLFPGSAAAAERERWVVASPAPLGAPGAWRVTLTAPFINLASLVVFLVAGDEKSAIVRDVLEGSDERAAMLPARLVQPASGGLLWLLDQKAAALLTAVLPRAGLAAAGAAARPREGSR